MPHGPLFSWVVSSFQGQALGILGMLERDIQFDASGGTLHQCWTDALFELSRGLVDSNTKPDWQERLISLSVPFSNRTGNFQTRIRENFFKEQGIPTRDIRRRSAQI